MNTPAKTSSGTPCKRCSKKGARCVQHGGSPSPKSSSLRKSVKHASPTRRLTPLMELMTEEEWEMMKLRRGLEEKLVKIASPRKSPERKKASPKALRSPQAGRKAQPADVYEADIIEYLKMKEQNNRIPPKYSQYDRPRSVTVDWLVEVAEEYHLTIKTLHLGVALFDRFLFLSSPPLKHFQLYACACMLIASKYEEMFSPGVEEYVYIADNTFTKQALINAESTALGVLQYDIAVPTCIDFAEFYHDALNLDDKHKTMSNYVMDSSMIYTESFVYLPSLIAAASIFYANLALSPKGSPKSAWSAKMERVTGYTYGDVRSVLPSIIQWLSPNDKLKAVRLHYERSRYHKVALLPLISL